MADIESILAEALEVSVREIRQAITATGSNATGRTAKSLEARVRKDGEGVVGGVYGRPYAWALETGSRPATRRGTEAERQRFINDLYLWCKARGLPNGAVNEAQRLRFAKFLKWRINKYGTQLFRRGGRRDIITPSFERLGRELPGKIGGYYVTEIVKGFDKIKQ